MTADEWATSSGLGAWTVRELYAHVARGVWTLGELVGQSPLSGEPELSDAAAYFAALRPLGEPGAARVAETARAFATEHTDPALVDAFDGPAGKALTEAAAAENAVVRSIAGTIRVADFLVTRIVEATVHLLDLSDVIPHASPPPPDALHRTVDVLADLSSPVDFVRLATGRPAAAVFPVLT